MKAIIIGYGKMGREIEKILAERGHEVVLVVDADNSAELNAANLARADVAIEFTTPATACANIRTCLEHGTAVVSGTTGWTERLPEMQALCRQRGGAFFYASNYCLGVNLLFRLNRQLAAMIDRVGGYEVRIGETHHTQKKDAPSGTAITLAGDIIEGLDRKEGWVRGQENMPYDPKMLRIDSLRRGEVPGIHTVRYDSEADCITISHEAHSRKGFAIGAVLAAEYTKDHSGLLTIGDMFRWQ